MQKLHDLSFLQLFKDFNCIFPILARAPCKMLLLEIKADKHLIQNLYHHQALMVNRYLAIFNE